MLKQDGYYDALAPAWPMCVHHLFNLRLNGDASMFPRLDQRPDNEGSQHEQRGNQIEAIVEIAGGRADPT